MEVAMEKKGEGSTTITEISDRFKSGNANQEFFILPNVCIKEELDTDTTNDLLEEVEPLPLQPSATKTTDQQSNDSINHNDKSYSNTKNTYKNSQWYEPVPMTDFMCRCRLCNVKMASKSFEKHLQSKMHANSLRQEPIIMRIKREVQANAQQWDIFVDQHPWICADPMNPEYAYCKYCKKRLFYGSSEAKRLLHENSGIHKKMLEEYNQNLSFDENKQKKDTTTVVRTKEKAKEDADSTEHDGSESDDDDDDDDVDDNVCNEVMNNSDTSSESDTDSVKKRKRFYRGSEEWFNIYPWSKRYVKDPNYMYCSYCDVVLSLSLPRPKHEKSSRHRIAEELLKRKCPKAQYKNSLKDKRVKYYPWLMYSKNPSQFYCKYCCIRFSKFASRRKHENSKQHQAAAAAFQKKLPRKSSSNTKNNENNTENTPKAKSSELDPNDMTEFMKEKISLWQKRFPWISYKNLRPNYVFCKLCELAVYMPTLKYATKHQCSSNHINQRNKLKQQAPNKSIASEKLLNVVKVPFVWYVPEKNNRKFGKCKYCNVKVFSSFRQRHCMSGKHRAAKKLYDNRENNKGGVPDLVESNVNTDVSEEDNDDVVQAETETNSNNVISSAQSVTTNLDAENSALSGPAPKRFKMAYECAVETAQRLTHAHFELLRLTRQQNKNDAKSQAKAITTIATTSKTNAITTHSTTSPVMKEKSTLSQIPIDTTPKTQASTSLDLSRQPQLPAVEATVPSQLATLESIEPIKTHDSLTLFISSISETIKQLPVDLIAEWKMKVMQIVYSFELRAWRRQQGLSDQCDSNDSAFDDGVTTLPEVVLEMNGTTQHGDKSKISKLGQQQNAQSKHANFTATGISDNRKIGNGDQNEKVLKKMVRSNVSSSSSSTSSTTSSGSGTSIVKECTNSQTELRNKAANNNNDITQKSTNVTISDKFKILPHLTIPTSGLHHIPPKPTIGSGKHYLPTLPPHIQVLRHPKSIKSAAAANALADVNSNTTEPTTNKTNHTGSSSSIGLSMRHVQINSQTHSRVIPVNTWAQPPQRRLSLNLTPQQLHQTILSTLRGGSSQKLASSTTTTKTNVSANVTRAPYCGPQQCSTPK